MFSTKLCQLILKLYPAEFQREFATEIAASFDEHYQKEKLAKKPRGVILISQTSDILDLLSVAMVERTRAFLAFTSKKTNNINVTKGAETMKSYQVIWKWFFAWQAEDEARWLQEMSREGWEFVEYKWFRYFFRKQKEPVEYEYLFERNLFTWWQIPDEERYIECKAEEGWEFIKYFLMWYYFRRPIIANSFNSEIQADPFERKEFNLLPKNATALLQLGVFSLIPALVLMGLSFIPGIPSILAEILSLLGGFFTGIGLALIIFYIITLFRRVKKS